jgi:transcriptional regulator with XRE-family HTH domain
VISAPQLRAARALLGIDLRQLADLAGLSVPTIQRMEASEGVIRGNVDSLMKLIAALDAAGIELIAEGAISLDNIEFAAKELLEAPGDQRPAMLEGIAKALTRRLLQDNPGIGIRAVSERVTAFINAVRAHLE